MGAKEMVLNVDGMTRVSWVRHVKGAFRGLDGIGVIEGKVRDRKVRVQYDEQPRSLSVCPV